MRQYAPALGILLITVAITVLSLVFEAPTERLGGWGYLGAFIVMLINNLTLLLPALGAAFIVTASQTLNPLLLGVVGGAGAALGELAGYALGHSGGRIVGGGTFYQWYRAIAGVRGNFFGPMLFLFAVTPLPFDVAGVLAGAARYPVWKFLMWVGLGKIISTTLLAVASFYTIDWLGGLFS